ncbi:CPBP family glutamic-type intramembrane protease [Actinoplanes sp. TRM 88003]|uniref:CPBP family glutamic-type intramembrane protease n=1 Tax=Paractinoplanes aksuensis TaxID=2939490 RepID=A0ABT1DZS6_9ACTN|nr:CPBP family intramembrane glutamic endopeptidase [Actinoplanes aksuensis]MCO8276338.1 CPBP family glutamic-type intramembrane protease [Actinoplanes aksuensis]
MAPLILSVLLVLMLLTDVFVGTTRTRRLLAQVQADPSRRVRFYRTAILSGWARAAVAMLVVLTASFTEPPAAPGVDWPDLPITGMLGGAPLAWGLTGWVTLAMLIGGYRLRKRMRAGYQPPGRAQIAVLIPRTVRERRFAAALSVTAGITEEIVFRYALVVLGIEVFHLPTLAAVVLSLLLFVGIHAYQGRLGMVNSGFLGFVFAFLTLLSGSLLPAILLHIVIDLNALLLVPAEPTPRPAEPASHPAEPASRPAGPTPHPGDLEPSTTSPADPAPPGEPAVTDATPAQTEAPAQAAPTIRPPIPAG